MFGKKNKPTIDLQDDKERKAMELAALEASLDFLKRPAKPAEDENAAEGEGRVKEVTAADRARAQKFGRRMDYKTAVVKRGSDGEDAENAKDSGTEDKAAEENVKTEEAPVSEKESEAVTETVAVSEAETAAEAVTGGETTVVEEVKAEAAKNAEKAEAAEDETAKTAEPDVEKEEEQGEKTSRLIIAEAPVPDTGEEEAPILIDNPLPTPKKHVPKEMDFDLEPDADHMHFDVVDMKGKDFFDI